MGSLTEVIVGSLTGVTMGSLTGVTVWSLTGDGEQLGFPLGGHFVGWFCGAVGAHLAAPSSLGCGRCPGGRSRCPLSTCPVSVCPCRAAEPLPRAGQRVLPAARVGARVLPAHGRHHRELARGHQVPPARLLHLRPHRRLGGQGTAALGARGAWGGGPQCPGRGWVRRSQRPQPLWDWDPPPSWDWDPSAGGSQCYGARIPNGRGSQAVGLGSSVPGIPSLQDRDPQPSWDWDPRCRSFRALWDQDP